jgi:lipopolysaccharide export system protein LptA
VTAQQLEVNFGGENRLETAILSGDVHIHSESPEHSDASAGRAVLSFGQSNKLTKVHAEQQVRLLQAASSKDSGQNLEATAPAMDLFFAAGEKPSRAETIGPPEMRLTQVSGQHSQTSITADRFTAKFDAMGQLSQVHGEAHARLVTTTPSQGNAHQPDRVSTSDSIDAGFHPGTGLESVIQQGHFEYTSGAQQAFAQQAQYTPADQMIALHGSPRIVDGGMRTTADAVRLNRSTGDGFAEGDVKTSYNDLKSEPGGALLASSDPVHVTADSMTARNSPAIATYTGNVRLWQDANMIVAPNMQFQRDQRVVIADSNTRDKVSTTLITVDNRGKATPVDITADHLTYSDREREARYDGSVTVQSTNVKLTANQMNVLFAPASAASRGGENGRPGHSALSSSSAAATPTASQTLAKLDTIIASGAVVITQPTRRATGNKLTYTATDDKFVLTGGPPCIFDAEQGKITGVSLTLYRTDDRVIVDGTSSSPAVTKTRVVR